MKYDWEEVDGRTTLKVSDDSLLTLSLTNMYQWVTAELFGIGSQETRLEKVTLFGKTKEDAIAAAERFIDYVKAFQRDMKTEWDSVPLSVISADGDSYVTMLLDTSSSVRHQLQLLLRDDDNYGYFVMWQPWKGIGVQITDECLDHKEAMKKAAAWVNAVASLQQNTK